MVGDELMTGAEAAKYLRVHRETFGKWVAQGWIVPTSTVGLRVQFSRDSLDRFARENTEVMGRTKKARSAGGEG